jgi:hypothetical protein
VRFVFSAVRILVSVFDSMQQTPVDINMGDDRCLSLRLVFRSSSVNVDEIMESAPSLVLANEQQLSLVKNLSDEPNSTCNQLGDVVTPHIRLQANDINVNNQLPISKNNYIIPLSLSQTRLSILQSPELAASIPADDSDILPTNVINVTMGSHQELPNDDDQFLSFAKYLVEHSCAAKSILVKDGLGTKKQINGQFHSTTISKTIAIE